MSEVSQFPTGMLSIRLKTLAAELPAIDIPASATVNELKNRIRNEHPFIQSVSKRLCLTRQVENEQRIELTDESKTLESCGVADGSDLVLTIESLPEISQKETESLFYCGTKEAIEILAQRTGTLDFPGYGLLPLALSKALACNNTITSVNTGMKTHPPNSKLEDTDRWYSQDKNVAMDAIADMLLQNKSIRSLILSEARISVNCTARLVKAARQNGTVTELGIAGFFTNSTVIAELLAPEAKFASLEFDVNSHADQLSRLIANNTTITSLKLRLTCGFGNFGWLEHESLPALSEMFAQNSSIQTLSIAHSELDSKSMEFLADAFKRNSSITALDLQNNELNYSDACIANLLVANPRIIKLNLMANELGRYGMSAIAVALANNTTLQELNLSKTSMSASGALEIAKMLESNTTITDLNLSENKIGTEGLASILNALERNCTIRNIDLTKIGVTRSLEQVTACAVLSQNRGVTILFAEEVKPIPQLYQSNYDEYRQNSYRNRY